MSVNISAPIQGVGSGLILHSGNSDRPFSSTTYEAYHRLSLDVMPSVSFTLPPDLGTLFSVSPSDLQLSVLRPAINGREKWVSQPSWSGCGQLIMAMIRPFPRMMTQSDSLPPFVHPISSGLYINRENPWRVELAPLETFSPPKPLAACISICHIFTSRTANSEEFLWRTVDNEHQQIIDEVSV